MPIYLDNKEIGFLTQPKIGYGGEYEGKSIIHEDGTQTLKLTTVTEPKIEVGPRSEPETWKRIRETLHTNPNDQFFLIGSGASDTFALSLNGSDCTVSVYGGNDGTTLLFSDVMGNTTKWSLYLRDLENYPLPNGLHFSDLQGCPYSDDVVGECELFAVVVHKENDGICLSVVSSPTTILNAPTRSNVLEYAGNSANTSLLCLANTFNYNCEFVFLGDSLTTIGSSAFSNCHGIRSINIPDGVTTIDVGAFSSCYSLRSINLPDSLTTIGSSAFSMCSNLQTIKIPDGVTTIGSSVFSNCSSLQTIKIPSGTTAFDVAVSNCYSLQKLESNCMIASSYLEANNCALVRYINMPNVRFKYMNMYGSINNVLYIGLFGEVEDSESPTLGLKTPIFVDYVNSTFTGNSIPIRLYYTCLTLDHLKSIFDWLPVVETAKTMKCGYQYTMDMTTGTLSVSTAFDDFLAWYNTLPDADPGDGTIWKKGWSVTR